MNSISGMILLAERTPWKSMASGFRGSRARLDSGDLWVALLLLAVVVAGALLLARLVPQRERRRRFRPQALFRDLCRAHGLDRNGRRLLAQLAEWYQLEHPACLFLDPSYFASERLSPALRQQESELTRIESQIFAVPEGWPPAPSD